MAPGAMSKPVRYPALDAARGLAAVGILLFHAVGVYARGSSPDAWVRPWVARLDVAVPVFFLLSGFLLYRPFVRARREGARASMGAYAWRRALRILPAYWVALTLATIVLGLPGVFTVTGAVRYYGLLQAYDANTVGGGLAQAWTLCIEVAFYAFLPLWALVLRRLAPGPSLRPEVFGLAALAAASVAWKAWVLAAIAPAYVGATYPWLIAMPAYLDMFALGMALAVASVRWQERGGAPLWARGGPGLWWLAAAALYAVASVGAGLDDVDPRGFTHGEFVLRHVLYAAIAATILLPLVAGAGHATRALSTRTLAALGTVSYGVFLYHLPLLALLGRWHLSDLEDHVHPYLLWTTAALAGSLLLATASWKLVEAPALRLRRLAGPRLRVSRRPKRAGAG
jgi:peptidoglycan/LPS O-acetylase OafA/YrhL